MTTSIKKNWGSFILLILLVLFLAGFIYEKREIYSAPYDLNYWQSEFSNSQVVMGDKADHFFSDYDLYAILGYKYITGENPANLHPEVPPLGKQLIGLGILVFKNQNIASLIFGLASLVPLYFLALKIMHNSFLSLLAVLITVLNSEFRLLLVSSNLDIFQLFFLTVSIFFFSRGLKKPFPFFPLAAFFLGGAMATKFFLNGLLLLGVYLLFLTLKGKFDLFLKFVLSLPVIFVGYFLPYAVTLWENPNLLDFLRFQRWLTGWWAGSSHVPWGGVFIMLATGWWRTWWPGPEFIRVKEWGFSWPVISILGLASVAVFRKEKNETALLLWLWSGFFLVFISITPIFPRYLLAVFPFWNILAVYSLARVIAPPRLK